MANEKVQWQIPNVSYGQLAPSQASRTSFTPGKATSQAGDENWPLDHAIPQANPTVGFDEAGSGPINMQHQRTVLVGRNTVADQTVRDGANLTKDDVENINLSNIPEDTSGYDFPNE